MVVIKRIDVVSAMKVGALLSGLMFAVFGLLILLLQSAMLSAFSSVFSQSGTGLSSGNLMAAGLVGFCAFYVFGLIASVISGAISGAVGAFGYNLVANWVGGLRVQLAREVDDAEKVKRTVVVEG
jgi:multisubunit Na+/H+ antiporter MnhB subunit